MTHFQRTLQLFVLPLLFAAQSASADLACQQAYSRLYDKSEVRVSVYFGYSDFENEVFDGDEKAALLKTLTAPCLPGQFNCGFRRDARGSDVVTKTIRGPDGKNVKIRLEATNSSISTDNQKNLHENYDLQMVKSNQIHDKFMISLQQDDVVIYSGHARFGTGITFKPMTFAQWNEALRLRPDLEEIGNVLKNSPHTPKVIGVVACRSEEYYGQFLQQYAPNAALLLTRQSIQNQDSVRTLDASLDSLFGMKCAQDFRKSLSDANYFFYYNPLAIRATTFAQHLPEIYNFFEPTDRQFAFPPTEIASEFTSRIEKSRRLSPKHRDNAEIVNPNRH